VTVLEHVVLTIDPEQAASYETSFAVARPLIEGQPGCHGARLLRVLETPGRYVLLVEWATLEDHLEGFRNSPEFATWRELLHGFYTVTPEVEHGVDV
jgi:heme-degrading monooxygenase HmoA